MAFRLNKKNLAVTRAMPKGVGGNKRLNYVYASRQGTTATDGFIVARVTLPTKEGQPVSPVIYPKSVISKIVPVEVNEMVAMAGELPAATTAEHAVPNLDALFPEPKDQVAEFTCDAEQLLTLLKVVMDVSEDADHCIRLRLCSSPRLGQTMRIDSLAFPGHQAFCGVLKSVQYDGSHIAGALADGEVPTSMNEDGPKQTPLPLVLSSGRKFRG